MRRAIVALFLAIAASPMVALGCGAFTGQENSTSDHDGGGAPDNGDASTQGNGGDANAIDGTVLDGTTSVAPEAGLGLDGATGGGGTKYIFVTSVSYAVVNPVSTYSAFAGVSGANAVCGNHASTNSLLKGHAFQAWLATKTTGTAPPLDLVATYVLPNGVAVGTGAELAAGALRAPINGDDTGASTSGVVWTGATSSGKAVTTCTDWASGDSTLNAEVGIIGLKSTAWAGYQTLPCNQVARLYCVEQ
jgi:hypothetical protein